MTELTEGDLAEIRDTFTAKVDEVKQLPDRINNEVDKLKFTSPGLYLLVTGKRDDSQEKLKELIDKLAQPLEGLFAPWLFVDYAAKWQALGVRVAGAAAVLNRQDLNMEGDWDGDAYKSYTASRSAQLGAIDGIKALCNQVHDELLAVAADGRTLYTNMINKLGTMLAEVGVALGEAALTAGASLAWGINNLNAAIVAAVELVVQFITDFAEVGTKVYLAIEHFKNMITNPVGMVSNQGKSSWPTTESHEYDNQGDGWKQSGAE
ncbi:hypothetical protein [Nocardia carnea]|uniref:hypothetical protein n=1 Tax=Nocardia carnea TaxID=37328 RepID=UPI0024566C65|nr:hypothetical protein [Nocardia carnea]